MKSAVNWAVLGLVIERPSYGLEIAKRFERVYAHVLSLSGDSHVYAALDALESRKLIEVVSGAEIGRQPKLQYRATSAGIEAYEDWLVAQVDVERRRQELWVRQLSIFVRNPSTALKLIARFESEELKGAGQIGRLPERAGHDPRAELIDELVAEQHRIALGGRISWLRFARSRFEALARKSSADDPPRT